MRVFRLLSGIKGLDSNVYAYESLAIRDVNKAARALGFFTTVQPVNDYGETFINVVDLAGEQQYNEDGSFMDSAIVPLEVIER